MPLSTMLRMGTFNESDFSRLQANQVGIKIRIPQGFGLDVAASWLGIEVSSKAGVRNTRFDLEQIALREVRLPAGLLSGAKGGLEYELRLSDSSQGKFRELQMFLARARAEDINVRVVPKLSHSPKDAASVVVWIDLRLSTDEGYFPLVDGAEISLQDRPVGTG